MFKSELVTGPKLKFEKTSVFVVVVGGTAIALLLAFIFWTPAQPRAGAIICGGGVELDIIWKAGEIECATAEQCMQKARESFQAGLGPDEDTFHVYYHMRLTEEYLKKANVERIPPEFSGLEAHKSEAKSDLDTFFASKRVELHNLKQRRMFLQMVDVIEDVKSTYPHKGAREHLWALRQERRMKDLGTYPN